MLQLKVPPIEFYNEENGEFGQTQPRELRMEHSLVAIAKWESRWRVPFLDGKPKSGAMLTDYFRCMTLTPNVPDSFYTLLDAGTRQKIVDYIEADLSATTINDKPRPSSSKIVTSEELYYFLAAYHLPIEAQKWHLSRLIKLLRIAEEYNKPQKKMSRSEILARNRALNKARRAKLGTKG